MTVIAVRVAKGSIEMAGDTQTTWGWNKYPKKSAGDKQVLAQGKIFQVNGLTIGCAGDCAHSGLLQVFAKTDKPKEMERDSILEWFLRFKGFALDKGKIGFNDLSIHGILVSKKIAFTFFDHLEINKIVSFDAVGSGMFLAIGAMEVGATAEQAVKVAIKYDLYCGGKITKLKL